MLWGKCACACMWSTRMCQKRFTVTRVKHTSCFFHVIGVSCHDVIMRRASVKSVECEYFSISFTNVKSHFPFPEPGYHDIQTFLELLDYPECGNSPGKLKYPLAYWATKKVRSWDTSWQEASRADEPCLPALTSHKPIRPDGLKRPKRTSAVQMQLLVLFRGSSKLMNCRMAFSKSKLMVGIILAAKPPFKGLVNTKIMWFLNETENNKKVSRH